MKNWEKYEKELKEIGLRNIAILKNSDKVANCALTSCNDCSLYNIEIDCVKNLTKWLYSEYREPVVLTEDERKLCELLGRGWIARDKNGNLYWCSEKPFKDMVGEFWLVNDGDSLGVNDIFPQCKFNFIKWEDREDQEPWEIRI